MILAGLALGCAPKASNDSSAGDTQAESEPETFELIGSWEYTGSMAGLTNLMEIGETQIMDTGDYYGTDWNIVFTIQSWDNEADQVLAETASTEGYSRYEVGEPLYMSWRFEGEDLLLYLDDSAFQEPIGGTEGEEYVIYSRQ